MKESTSNLKKEALDWIKVVVISTAFALVLNNTVIVNANVPTPSMVPTIEVGNRLVANRLTYKFSEPKRFDIIVFKFPDNEKEMFVKRLIGLPGETVRIKSGKVYINDSKTPLADNFCNETPTGDFGPFVVPAGHYFMMGDNREHSLDSRAWNNKYVSKNELLGKVMFRYFPSIKVFGKE